METRKCYLKKIITKQFIVDVTLWMTVALPVLYIFMFGRPHIRGFFCDDLTISYPYRPDTITTPVLVVAGFATSIAVIVLVRVLNCLDSKCREICGGIYHNLKVYCVFLVGFVIEDMFVDVVKNKVGSLRPHFLDVCKPDFNRTQCPGYITEYTCSGEDEEKILKSRQSFPSGHSAFSAYIAVFFCIYIQMTLQTGFSYLLKVFMQCSLVFLAVLTGFERITDNQHHLIDVSSGFILGTSVAAFVWRVLGNKAVILQTTSETRQTRKDDENIEESQNTCCLNRKTTNSEPQTPDPLLPPKFFHVKERGQQKEANSDRDVAVIK